MNCKKCYKETPQQAAFCPWCGAKLTAKTVRRVRANGMGSAHKRGRERRRDLLTPCG